MRRLEDFHVGQIEKCNTCGEDFHIHAVDRSTGTLQVARAYKVISYYHFGDVVSKHFIEFEGYNNLSSLEKLIYNIKDDK